MAVVVPNLGAQEILSRALNKTATADLTLKLFENNYTPIETSAVGDFTEATFTGYSSQSIPGSGATITNADPSEASWAAKVFTSSAAQSKNVYGYYVVNAGGTICLWAERFTDGPYAITNNGDTVTVTPKLTLD
jgi:hypothetical protein